MDRPPDAAEIVEVVTDWYAASARDLPWREPGASAWSVLVSEVMLQQTPVARVLPVWREWCERWPTPAALAAATPGDAVHAWGRLGYPRRALRLHAAARAVVEQHGGEVPADHAALRALPGVGDYTAAAVAAFAHGGRHAVLDTNVRRVLGRVLDGVAAPRPAITRAERERAEALLPADGRQAARWSVGVMELGALVCTARAPRCGDCPLATRCRWLAAGRPETGPPRRAQVWEGTDRQARGTLLAVLRAAPGAVPRARLEDAWPEEVQRERALAGLLHDGLVEELPGGAYALPGRWGAAAG
ncbi:A/G-specific DNA-adenine glycosylase [Motilibacter rhizosphaerae]|uniref:Adenine DNA glycosylase n=1 Tax=Motilibacter rhizosphaerae TaxID=598652 RepID=A0A4Q7NAM8_9ACTN|nr:A/G-specific adenine glycosylase [Motilibacter rhizosphaerae]RZS79467.1 A/G-specific DNA-adenine glycosylase [Motilibacter rhizosphaerae]